MSRIVAAMSGGVDSSVAAALLAREAVEDEIIDLIKSRVGKDGFVQFNEELKRGDKVVIRDGPLANLVGIFERDVEDGDRVLMLLTAISYQGHVTVERELLKKIS